MRDALVAWTDNKYVTEADDRTGSRGTPPGGGGEAHTGVRPLPNLPERMLLLKLQIILQ